jgi:hypothetical protein
MKANIDNFYHLLNAVKKSNGIKSYLWYAATNFSYFISRLMRILNY